MIIKKMALPRRTFLRGMGTTLALPLLDAMFPALTSTAMAASNSVRRLGFVYIPMGMSPVEWTPQGEGRLTALSPSLSSLTPFLDQVTVITNTELKDMAYPTGNHAAVQCHFPQRDPSEKDRRKRLRTCNDGGSGCSQTTRQRDRHSFARTGNGPDCPDRQLRQWSCMRVPEQSFVVFSHRATSGRSGSATGLSNDCSAMEERRRNVGRSFGRTRASSTG